MKIRKEFNGFSRWPRETDITEMVLSRTEVKGGDVTTQCFFTKHTWISLCVCVCVCVCVCESLSHVRLFATPWTIICRLLCPWNSPGNSAGVSCRTLLQGIFLTQGSNPGLLNCRQILYWLSYQGTHYYIHIYYILCIHNAKCMKISQPKNVSFQ